MDEKFDPQSLIPDAPREPDLVKLLEQLESDDRNTRLEAIDALSRWGDEEVLEVLRERLRLVSREHQALIISIGTLRWRLSGTSHSSLDQHR
jgi:HEAT repeat protein